jgi:hypothetical protein
MFGSSAGAGTFASGAEHGVAAAGGAKPIGTTSPIVVADTTDIEKIRRSADMSHLSRGEPSSLTSAIGLCDDSCQCGCCDSCVANGNATVTVSQPTEGCAAEVIAWLVPDQ